MTPAASGRPSRRSVLGLLGAASLAAGAPGRAAQPGRVFASAATPTGLAAAIQEVIDRPQFHGARWAMEFLAPGSRQPIYSSAPDQVAVAASAAKLFTAGVVFSTLGPDYRFRLPVYGTGPVTDGVLHGDLVLVACGDLLLSNRVQPDGSLALPIPDHSYDLPNSVPIPGDPLRPIRHLAEQIAAHGIKRVDGRVLVDTSLFTQAQTGIGVSAAGLVTISPIMLNDNIVDITVNPGDEAGAPAVLRLSPPTGYVHIVNAVTTVPTSNAPAPLSFANDLTNPDGTHTVTLTGEILMSAPHLYRAYYVPDPARFAQIAFAEALADAGVDTPAGGPAAGDLSTPSPRHTTGNRLAEHVSPKLSLEAKVMLKTSSNVHTAMWEFVAGAIAGHDSTDPVTAYGHLQAALFHAAGLDADPSGYTPAFFAAFLAHMTRRPYFREYRDALPIMGRDGDLAGIQADSAAAGHVYAKTGTAGPAPRAARPSTRRSPDSSNDRTGAGSSSRNLWT